MNSLNLLKNIIVPTVSLRDNPKAYFESFKIHHWQWFQEHTDQTKYPEALDGTIFPRISSCRKKKERNS